MKRVLVTGATGFIGRHCLEPLVAREFEVHAVHNVRPVHATGPASADDAVRWHACDLLSVGAAAALISEIAPTHLLHLAWYAVPGK